MWEHPVQMAGMEKQVQLVHQATQGHRERRERGEIEENQGPGVCKEKLDHRVHLESQAATETLVSLEQVASLAQLDHQETLYEYACIQTSLKVCLSLLFDDWYCRETQAPQVSQVPPAFLVKEEREERGETPGKMVSPELR